MLAGDPGHYRSKKKSIGQPVYLLNNADQPIQMMRISLQSGSTASATISILREFHRTEQIVTTEQLVRGS